MENNKTLIMSGLKSIVVNYGHRNTSPFNLVPAPKTLSYSSGDDFVSDCIEYLFKESLSDDMFVKNFETGDFTSFLLACQKVGIECSKDERLYNTIKQKTKELNKQIMSWNSIGYSQRQHLDLYGRMINSLDYEDIDRKSLNRLTNLLENMSSWYKSSYTESLSNIYSVIFNMDGETKEGLKSIQNKYVKDIKKTKKESRLPIFVGLIKSGKLDKKTARKMRSDASEYVSQRCIEELFNHKKLYDPKTFKTLFLQFGDSNYYQVRRYLADNVPANEIMCLMGTDCESTKSILQRRFNEYYAQREESDNEQ